MKGLPEPTEPFIERGPGARLRAAREAAHIPVDKVSTALLLDTGTIEALEADAFDRLPAPTFVRGYLRGYARIVGLPAAPILELYDSRGFEPPPLGTGISESSQAHTSDTAVRVVTYAVAAVLVVLVAAWWHSQEGGGFGIGSDLLDWSSDPESESAAESASESESATESASTSDPESEADSSLAFADVPGAEAPGEPAESIRDGESLVPPARQDAEPDDGATEPASADDAGTEAMTESDAPATSAPRSEVADEDSTTVRAELDAEISGASGAPPVAGDATATDDATAVATERAAGDEVATAGALAAAGESIAGAATAGAPTTSGGTVAEADSTAVTFQVRDESDAEAGPTAGDETADTTIPALTSAARTEAPPTPSVPASSGAETSLGAATIRSGLVLEFVHESWVEVYDRERTRLFFGLVQPGRVLEFDGAQPFDVLLGFGKDVRVTIDGEAFDHTPFIKHGVARFKLGTSPSVEAGTSDSSPAAESGAAAEPDAATEPDATTGADAATGSDAATDTGTTDNTAESGGA